MKKYLIIIIILITGCAHKYSESQYKVIENQLNTCEQSCATVSDDNSKIKSKLLTLEDQLKKSMSDKEQCQKDMQGLLDRNLESLQYSKTLLQQMSSYKTIIQERSDSKTRSSKAFEYIASILAKERAANQVFIMKNNEKIKIVIPQKELFAGPKSAWMMPKGEVLIEKISKGLNHLKPIYIEIGGHTDSSHIPDSLKKTYPNNWYLSQARALSVLDALESDGINKDKMCAIAYADTRPMASNSSEAGMAMNRRVEISILP